MIETPMQGASLYISSSLIFVIVCNWQHLFITISFTLTNMDCNRRIFALKCKNRHYLQNMFYLHWWTAASNLFSHIYYTVFIDLHKGIFFLIVTPRVSNLPINLIFLIFQFLPRILLLIPFNFYVRECHFFFNFKLLFLKTQLIFCFFDIFFLIINLFSVPYNKEFTVIVKFQHFRIKGIVTNHGICCIGLMYSKKANLFSDICNNNWLYRLN